MVTTMSMSPRIADIFRFPKIKKERPSRPSYHWFQHLFAPLLTSPSTKVPELNEENPLSLFYHAGNYFFFYSKTTT